MIELLKVGELILSIPTWLAWVLGIIVGFPVLIGIVVFIFFILGLIVHIIDATR